MNQHHELGFEQFAGRGLRYVTAWRGQWMALVGWQTGVSRCKLRDPWLGWSLEVHGQRLDWIADNTRFLLLPAVRNCPQLGAHGLGPNLQRLSADWQAEWGHPLELAESFGDPSWGDSAVYQAAHWLELGGSRS